VLPGDADWFLLAGDLTALPAIARILENLPGTARGRALIELPHPEEVQALAHPPGIEVVWLHPGRDGAPVRLADAVVGTVPPEGARAYLFCGAEAATARPIRRHARQVLRLAPERVNVLNYWKVGLAEGRFDYC
jgi:NADPH-dependent ferric siderophore reductase